MRSFRDIGRIKVFIKDPNKKSFLRIIKELCVLFITKKEIPFYYFKHVYKKEVKNYRDYLSTKEVVAIGSSKLLHKPEYKALLDDKLSFTELCEKMLIKTPQLISYNIGSNFYFNNKKEVIDNKEKLDVFFEKVFNSSKTHSLFFRPLSSYGGKGCFKLNKPVLNLNKEEVFQTLTKKSYIHTEVIKQHEKINKIHGNCVNTIRIISLITMEKNIEIICAFMRFGVGSGVVDNASSGGFYVGINLDNGTLKQSGRYMLEYGGREIFTHPNSGFKLEGFKIPFFKEACKEVIKAVKVIPDRFIGWDIAITQNGPVIVEANWGPHLFLSDYAYGGLLKNKHIKNLIKELKTVN